MMEDLFEVLVSLLLYNALQTIDDPFSTAELMEHFNNLKNPVFGIKNQSNFIRNGLEMELIEEVDQDQFIFLGYYAEDDDYLH